MNNTPLLFRIADRRRTGRVTIADWANFDNLLNKADAEYEIAFRLFDVNGTGVIKFEDFQKLYDQNKSEDALPFDWKGEWASLYVGGRKQRHDMTYAQFSQMMRGIQGERVRQAFQHFDKNGDGYIEPEEFQKIILETAAHKLSDHLLENLHTLCNISSGTKISYANVRAFQKCNSRDGSHGANHQERHFEEFRWQNHPHRIPQRGSSHYQILPFHADGGRHSLPLCWNG